ncbi:uncharacterized protein [Nicotiana sylvestris]|uniref:uncharacterized protein n=1 Tax=Nicotiana sylvestris TaxID=4096 RepID=UPI00388CAA96
MSLKIKDEVTKQIKAKVLWVVEHPTWLANIIPIPKKDGKVRERTLLKYTTAGACSLIELQISKEWALERFWYQKQVNIIRYLLNIEVCALNNMAEYEALIPGLNMAIDMNIHEVLVIDDLDFFVHYVQGEWATKNFKIFPYPHHVQELRKRFTKIECRHMPRIQNEFVDALATLSSMIHHPNKNLIDPIQVRIHNQPAYCAHIEEETDGKPWIHDIKEYLAKEEYLEHANNTQKCTLQRLSNHFFHSGGNLYRRMPDLGLLRCVDAKEASKLFEEIHDGTCGPHMNGFVLAKKILRASYFWMTVEIDCLQFILVAIDYFTKWVETTFYKVVTNKVIADFVKDRIVCRFGVPESIVTDNATNLSSDMMKSMCEIFIIKHKNSTIYRPQMNGAIEVANKNIKKILRKMVENHKKWHKKIPFALLGYRTTVRTSTGETSYMLVYGTQVVIPTEIEVPSLRVLQEVELSDPEWIKRHYEQLDLIDRKRMSADEANGKFSPNWKDPYIVQRVLTGGALILAEMDGEVWPRDTMFRLLTFLQLM